MCHYEGPNPMTPPVNQGIAMDRVSWWYLSYCDDDGFRGCCVVKASDMLSATMASIIIGINPGGEVLGAEMTDEHAAPFPKDVLISKEELFRIDANAVRVNSAGERVEQ